MSRLGLKLAMYEHRWENYTNYAIITGILITGVAAYYRFGVEYNDYTVSSTEIGLVSLAIVGLCHLIARIGHKGEQILMRDSRPWVKKK